METISIPLDYAAIFIIAYALATIITYKLMIGKTSNGNFLELKNK